MKQYFLLLGSLLCTLSGVLSQMHHSDRCGFDHMMKQQLAWNPQLQQRMEANEAGFNMV